MTTATLCRDQCDLPLARTCGQLILVALCWLTLGITVSVQAGSPLPLRLGGTPEAVAYARLLLESALETSGHEVAVEVRADRGDIPMTRLEVMLQQGEISALILGQTAERDRRFLPVLVGMTDSLVNHRILFIHKGSQPRYDAVYSLEDFRRTGRVAAIGEAWADRVIWEINGLPVETISGDWRRLYRMVASPARKVDYLPRGAHEMSQEWAQYPELDVERNLVFVYDQDHILYVSPAQPELHRLLLEVMPAARDSGLIRRLARKHYAEVFEPPVSLQERRLIRLESGAP
ncbi:hypothetical protein [Pseudomonas sp. MYb185]|uniref:hypothetical protein n=1 Tax=Pseudomonas sp. MYb185 TaxID=1848729 RepID=UPI00211565FD|nr:hypothetical protein [Pseudomonas sp. MYb185]